MWIKDFGIPACSTGGYPQLKRGSLSNYVLIAQDYFAQIVFRMWNIVLMKIKILIIKRFYTNLEMEFMIILIFIALIVGADIPPLNLKIIKRLL